MLLSNYETEENEVMGNASFDDMGKANLYF